MEKSQTEELVDKLDRRFMRADLLEMTFKHINVKLEKLDKIEVRLETIFTSFDERYGSRITKLEEFRTQMKTAIVILYAVTGLAVTALEYWPRLK